jgi:hypothetical protein
MSLSLQHSRVGPTRAGHFGLRAQAEVTDARKAWLAPRMPGLSGLASFQVVNGPSGGYPLTTCRGHLNERTVLNAKRLPYLLVLLLISALVDDTWAVAPDSPFASAAEDNDEYLPAQRRPQEELITLGQWPPFVCLEAQPADLSAVQARLPSGPNPATPFTPQPLYAFMSLRI